MTFCKPGTTYRLIPMGDVFKALMYLFLNHCILGGCDLWDKHLHVHWWNQQ